MGKKKKVISIPPKTIEKVREDLNGDGVKFYELNDLPKDFIGKGLLHPEVCSKCDTFVACVSGSQAEGREYMFLAGLRQDSENGYQVTDIDPIGMIYDLSTESPSPSGIAIFHGDFTGRTEIDYSSTAVSVKVLKGKLGAEIMSFDEAPKRFTNAIHFVAKNYKANVDDT